MNNIQNISEKSEEDSQQDDDSNKLAQDPENKLYKDLLNKIKNEPIIVNRLDYYPNSIPLGSFCFAVSFILYGFYETKIQKNEDNFLYIVIFFFGVIC